MGRKATLKVLESRFPGQVPPAVVERIRTEADLNKLERWFELSITATLEAFQQGMD